MMSFFWFSLASFTKNSLKPLKKALKSKSLPNIASYSDKMTATLPVLLDLPENTVLLLYGHILYKMIYNIYTRV